MSHSVFGNDRKEILCDHPVSFPVWVCLQDDRNAVLITEV